MDSRLVVVIPFCQSDKALAITAAEWLRDLGGVKEYDCFLCMSRATTSDGVIEPLRDAFRSVEIFIPHEEAERGSGPMPHAQAATRMFKSFAWHAYYIIKRPFLWYEPDCVAMRKTWLDEISGEYFRVGKPFLGTKGTNVNIEMMNGCMVYPPNVCDYSTAAMMADATPWDMAGGRDFVKHGHVSPLFQHVYLVLGDAPTFPRDAHLIKPETALFHRSKDGSLIRMLREKVMLGGSVQNTRLGGNAEESEGAVVGSPSATTSDYLQKIEEFERKEGDASLTSIHKTEQNQSSTGSNAPPKFKPESGEHRPIMSMREVMEAEEATPSIGDQIRQHVNALAQLLADKPTRKTRIVSELRRVKVIPRTVRRRRHIL